MTLPSRCWVPGRSGKTDYYPFGAVAKQWNNPDQTQQEEYRHGYQGQFSEMDTTTGWNAFELRMYDPLIGRWLQVDPERQHSSPYLSMGNNPLYRVDPDGGCDDPPCDNGEGFVELVKEFFNTWIDQFSFDFSWEQKVNNGLSGNEESLTSFENFQMVNSSMNILGSLKTYHAFQFGKQSNFTGKPELFGQIIFVDGEIYFGPGVDYGGSWPNTGINSIGYSYGITWGEPGGADYGLSAGGNFMGYEYGSSFDGSSGNVGITLSTAGYWGGANVSYTDTYTGWYQTLQTVKYHFER